MINQNLRTFDSVIETCSRNRTPVKTYNSRKEFDDVSDILDHQFDLIKQELLRNKNIHIIGNSFRDQVNIKYYDGNTVTYLGEIKRNDFTSSYSMNINPELSDEKLKVMNDIAYFANAVKEWDNNSAVKVLPNKVDSNCPNPRVSPNKWDYNLSNSLYY